VAQRRAAARDQRHGRAATRKQGRGREAACGCPYPTVVLLRLLFDGGEQRSGGAASSRSAVAMAVAESSGARVSRAEAAAVG
jgi:hypothetical protein